VLLLALPCAWRCWSFRQPLVAVLFHYGAFTRATWPDLAALQGYGVGLLGLVGVKVLAPGFYARRTCARRCASPSACWCHAADEPGASCPGWAHAGAGAVDRPGGALGNAGFLLRGLLRAAPTSRSPAGAGFALKVLLACVVLGAAAGLGRPGHRLAGLGAQPLARAGCAAAWMAAGAAGCGGSLLGHAVAERACAWQQFRRRA
jgi:putative peptidoglycan lipid II flippase